MILLWSVEAAQPAGNSHSATATLATTKIPSFSPTKLPSKNTKGLIHVDSYLLLMEEIRLTRRFYTFQMVQDFGHQQYLNFRPFAELQVIQCQPMGFCLVICMPLSQPPAAMEPGKSSNQAVRLKSNAKCKSA